jgi:hypothetical protein
MSSTRRCARYRRSDAAGDPDPGRRRVRADRSGVAIADALRCRLCARLRDDRRCGVCAPWRADGQHLATRAGAGGRRGRSPRCVLIRPAPSLVAAARRGPGGDRLAPPGRGRDPDRRARRTAGTPGTATRSRTRDRSARACRATCVGGPSGAHPGAPPSERRCMGRPPVAGARCGRRRGARGVEAVRAGHAAQPDPLGLAGPRRRAHAARRHAIAHRHPDRRRRYARRRRPGCGRLGGPDGRRGGEAYATSAGCRVLLPGDRLPSYVSADLRGWRQLHRRLALLEPGARPSVPGIDDARRVVSIRARDHRRATAPLRAADQAGRDGR